MDPVCRNAGLVCQELGIDGLMTLPVRLRPDIEVHGAIPVKFDLRGFGSIPENTLDIVTQPLPSQ